MNSHLEGLIKLKKSNERSDIQMVIMNAINSLSDIEKEVILLRIIKGYPVGDVSIVLDRPEEVVKKLQFNAMKKISLEINKNKFASGKFTQYEGTTI